MIVYLETHVLSKKVSLLEKVSKILNKLYIFMYWTTNFKRYDVFYEKEEVKVETVCYSKTLNVSYFYAKTTQSFFNHGMQGSRGKNIIWCYCFLQLIYGQLIRS